MNLHKVWPAVPCVALLLTITACSTSPAAGPGTLSPPPSGSPTPSKPTGVASEPLVFRYETPQLAEAIPPRYRGVTLDVSSLPFNPNRTYTPRPDPLAGQVIEPESCRSVVRGEAWPSGQYGGLPSETPSADGYAVLGGPVTGTEPYVSASVIELTGAKATSFLGALPTVAPECASIRITDGSGPGQASAIERSLPEFGVRSRYIVRTYPLGGAPWVERILLFPSARYVTEIRLYGSRDSEAVFLAFAREVRDRAAQKLK